MQHESKVKLLQKKMQFWVASANPKCKAWKETMVFSLAVAGP